MFFRVVFLWTLLLWQGSAKLGVDISVPTNSSVVDCLWENSIKYVSSRVYRCIGETDPVGARTMQLARAHVPAFDFVDGYMFPCVQSSAFNVAHNYSCPSGAAQVEDTLNMLEEAGIVGPNSPQLRIWLDIEEADPPQYFDLDPAVNQQLVSEMVTALESKSVSVGIYTTKTYWKQIMGDVVGYGSKYPLWYPRYDGINSMDFFVPFADFKSVMIKQTSGDTPMCGISLDNDFMQQ